MNTTRLHTYITSEEMPSFEYKLKALNTASSGSRMALVTGGSRDLGWFYARDLAKRGYGCVVTSRSAASAQKAAATLEAEFPGQIFKGVALDLSKPPTEWTPNLVALEKEGVQLSVVVLNAAMEWTGRFEDADAGTIEALLTANVMGMTMVTRWCVQHMKNLEGPRLIVGCSAVSTFIRLHYGEVYCATRDYQSAFFTQLGSRLKKEGSNVRVCLAETSVVTTDALVTKMNAAAVNGEKTSAGEMAAQDQSALSALQMVSLQPPAFCRGTLDAAFGGASGPVVLGWLWRLARFVQGWTGLSLMFPATPRDREMYNGDTSASTKVHWTALK